SAGIGHAGCEAQTTGDPVIPPLAAFWSGRLHLSCDSSCHVSPEILPIVIVDRERPHVLVTAEPLHGPEITCEVKRCGDRRVPQAAAGRPNRHTRAGPVACGRETVGTLRPSFPLGDRARAARLGRGDRWTGGWQGSVRARQYDSQ